MVKCGQLLSLFGGTDYRLKAKGIDFADYLTKDHGIANPNLPEEDEQDEGKVMPPIRPDIHLLMVGEPGLGKS